MIDYITAAIYAQGAAIAHGVRVYLYAIGDRYNWCFADRSVPDGAEVVAEFDEMGATS